MILKEIEERRAYRALSEETIAKDILDRILRAATLAPSCGNKQPWRFLVLNSPEKLDLVKEHFSGSNYWGKKSPAIIAVITADHLDAQLSGSRNYAYFDTGMACMNLQLQAQKEGLFSHPIAGFNAIDLKSALGIPEEFTLLTLILLAYPGSDSELSAEHRESEKSNRQRKPLSDVIMFNNW